MTKKPADKIAKSPPNGEPIPSQRLDVWLWHARIFKTRSLAGRICVQNGVRINGHRTEKPARRITPGDILTFALGHKVWALEVLKIGTRRGPAAEARTLYREL